MIAIKIDAEHKVVYQHYRPEMIDTTNLILVESIPEPEIKDGYYGELYYTEDKGFWYEYLPLPTVEEPQPIIPTISYDDLVDSKIRAKYSVSEEFAILRQKEDKPAEWQEYYNYCEQCKQEAKAELGILTV